MDAAIGIARKRDAELLTAAGADVVVPMIFALVISAPSQVLRSPSAEDPDCHAGPGEAANWPMRLVRWADSRQAIWLNRAATPIVALAPIAYAGSYRFQ